MYSYRVIADDNFHHMDEGEQYEVGEFASCEDAIAACKKNIDDFLHDLQQEPRPSEDLWWLYRTFGETPILMTADPHCRFSAWDYAKQRCDELAQDEGQEI